MRAPLPLLWLACGLAACSGGLWSAGLPDDSPTTTSAVPNGVVLATGPAAWQEAAQRGYEPDHSVSAAEVPEGRPAPWMCLENAKYLGVYPFEAIVKVDDTVPGIEEGINAGMWTVGLAKSGNEVGLTEPEIEALPADELERRLARAHTRMQQAGAHYVVDGIWDLLPCLDDIEARLARGECPQHG